MKQSFAWWCFARSGLDVDELLAAAARMGYAAAELAEPEQWQRIKDHGLVIASTNGHDSIESGLNRVENHDRIEHEVHAKLADAVKWGIPNLICFSGNRDGLDDRTAIANTVEGLRRLAPAAEEAGVTLVLELLNSKVDHPDYQCDHTWWGVEVVKQVNSPRVRLLYDVYHMQIMEGDIIRTIHDHHHYFAHYHTAGNPGRHDIDDDQELNYSAIYRTIAATDYDGYIGHEFVPRGDPIEALEAAYTQCERAIRPAS